MALNIAEGVVERTGSKVINGKNGEFTAYSAKVGGEWYGFGSSSLSFGEGDKIQFTYKLNGKYKNADKDNLEILSKAEPQVSTATSSYPSVNSTEVQQSKTGYWDAKEQRDIETNIRLDIVGARNSAIAYVTSALNAGALSLGSKKEGKEDLFRSFVDKMTAEFCLHPANTQAIEDAKSNVTEVEEDEAINPALEED